MPELQSSFTRPLLAAIWSVDGAPCIALFALIFALSACSAAAEDVPDTSSDTATLDAGNGETGSADAGADVAATVLRWQQHIPTHGKKLRAMTAGVAPGTYTLVGDNGSVVEFGPKGFKEVSPTNIGGAHLAAVYVDPKGRTVIAGEKSALAIYDDGNWLVAGEVPPAPAVQFLDVGGVGETYWAVGAAAQAWMHSEGAWIGQAVTVTEASEPIGPGANFVAVAAVGNEVWIACEPGLKSPGLALRKIKGGWTSYPLPTAPRDIWVAGDKVDGGVVVAGGTANEFVARFDGKKFVAETDLKWKQGFTAIGGLDASQVWIAGFKGQLRKSDPKVTTIPGAWQVVPIEAPPGTPGPFPPPSDDLVGIALHGADELAVITTYRMYRFGQH